jgi:hypothetical protein
MQGHIRFHPILHICYAFATQGLNQTRVLTTAMLHCAGLLDDVYPPIQGIGTERLFFCSIVNRFEDRTNKHLETRFPVSECVSQRLCVLRE